jgi:hypothetical protein
LGLRKREIFRKLEEQRWRKRMSKVDRWKESEGDGESENR